MTVSESERYILTLNKANLFFTNFVPLISSSTGGCQMNWAQAEHWLKVVYPESLPRSWHEIIDLWLLERIATQPRWLRLFKFIDGLRQIPRLLWLYVIYSG